MTDPYLELSDWRRTVAAMWARWRRDAADLEAGASASAAATLRFRSAKDALFRDHPQSPLPAGRRGSPFNGLAYYPYDPAWRITAHFEPATGAKSADPADPTAPVPSPPSLDLPTQGAPDRGGPAPLPTSSDQPVDFRRIGRLVLDGPLRGHSLSLFWIEGYAGGLFLPFRDTTSGTETYPAGRYLLDTAKAADQGWDLAAGTFVLDLNMAYFPSCAYDVCWSCPLAPPENRLPVAVRVGERLAASGVEAG